MSSESLFVYDWRNPEGIGESSPLDVPSELLKRKVVDKDGSVLEGCDPPVYCGKKTPFEITYSHDPPILFHSPADEFFTLFDSTQYWEDKTVFIGRGSLRSLGRCFLFPAEDYYCRDFILDVGYIDGRLIVQQHEDGSEVAMQKQGYGSVFEAEVTEIADQDTYALHEFLTMSIGKHKLMVRCTTDCIDGVTKEPISLTCRCLKKRKKYDGYYPLINPTTVNYFQEHWLHMVLSNTNTLKMGIRIEETGVKDVARIDRIETFTIQDIAKHGQLDAIRQRSVFEGINGVFSWLLKSFEQAAAATPTNGLLQGELRFSKTDGTKNLTLQMLTSNDCVELISDNTIEAINILREA